MKDKIINSSVNSILKYKKYSDDEIEKLKYGLEGLYLTISKGILLLLISILLNFLIEFILVLIFLNIIRYPAFGVHANKSIICLIMSILLIIGLPFIIFKIKINFILKLILLFLSFISYLLFAPADTQKRPLNNKKKRKYRKIFSCIIALIYILLILLLKNSLYINSIFSGLLIEAILINPLTYRILNMPYNNYKKNS